MVRKNSELIYSTYIVFIIISLGLLLLNTLGLSLVLRYPLELILVPPRKFMHSFADNIQSNSQILFSPDLKQKIIQMEEYKRQLEVLKQKIQLLEQENKTFRNQLETPLPPSWNYISAYVLGRERFLIIDKGLRDGVNKDMIVVSENIVVGKVFSVSSKTSQIQLLWDPDAKTSVKTDKNVQGLLTGSFGNKIVISKVLQKDPLNSLDIVMTSGEEGIFPPNLIIGKVDEVVAKQEDVYKEAIITPLIDYEKLQQVFIIASY